MKTAKQKATSTELDNKIVAMIQNGSASEKEEGFTLLFNKYKNSILFGLNKSLNFDAETANDLMMDVFTKIHLKFDSYSTQEGALSTWVFNIAKNTLIDHKRKEKYNILSLDNLLHVKTNVSDENEKFFQLKDESNSNDSFDLLVRDERATALIIALNKIKRDEVRKALVLSFFEEKTYKEIALELGIAEHQVKVFLHRGKKELKDLLEDDGFNL